ncbi:hypothetical protein G9A89_023446 [Geosiphon pyriformis]|nr:hypothetical protein G9A89_023446 [Geosiphon pyriformis]
MNAYVRKSKKSNKGLVDAFFAKGEKLGQIDVETKLSSKKSKLKLKSEAGIVFQQEDIQGFIIGCQLIRLLREKGQSEKLMNYQVGTKYWSKREDNLLLKGVLKFGAGNWALISKVIKTRSNKQAYFRWRLLSKRENVAWEKNKKSFTNMVEKKDSKWCKIFQNQKRNTYLNTLEPTKNGKNKNSWNKMERQNVEKPVRSPGPDSENIYNILKLSSLKKGSEFFREQAYKCK